MISGNGLDHDRGLGRVSIAVRSAHVLFHKVMIS